MKMSNDNLFIVDYQFYAYCDIEAGKQEYQLKSLMRDALIIKIRTANQAEIQLTYGYCSFVCYMCYIPSLANYALIPSYAFASYCSNIEVL